MNRMLRTLISKAEDSENEQNKKVATGVRPFKKLENAAMGKRQLILPNKSKDNDFNNNKKN